jgi:hypothetical protein
MGLSQRGWGGSGRNVWSWQILLQKSTKRLAGATGAALSDRSLRLERRLDDLLPTPGAQLQRYLTHTHTQPTQPAGGGRARQIPKAAQVLGGGRQRELELGSARSPAGVVRLHPPSVTWSPPHAAIPSAYLATRHPTRSCRLARQRFRQSAGRFSRAPRCELSRISVPVQDRRLL